MDLNGLLQSLARSAVRLSIGAGDGTEIGRFGGAPEVPEGFSWPCFETDTFEDPEVKSRPLTFLAQFDCAALADLEPEGLLPREGVLSFFYETLSQRWGFDPEDAGCARVFWFPDRASLSPAEFPADLEAYCRFPALPIRGRRAVEYPSYEEFSVSMSLLGELAEAGKRAGKNPWEFFNEARAAQRGYGDEPAPWHRLLGWPDIIQNSMTLECELLSQGYSTGSGLKDIPPEVLKEAEARALEDWRLLFQLDSGVHAKDFSLDFGDSGSIYFYIRKEDLSARRFDRVWLVLQCC